VDAAGAATLRYLLPIEPRSTMSESRAKVLVVDDELLVTQSICRGLAEHDTSSERDAVTALARIRNGERFHAILCDIQMPKLSGPDLYDVLRQEFPDQADRMAFLTGGAYGARESAFLDQVPNERLEKPYDLRELRALVRRLVEEARALG
jgi:CheY-like chemotaxis protein